VTARLAGEFHIASAIIQVTPAYVATVSDVIEGLGGAQIHMVAPDCRLVVTFESEDEATIPAQLSTIRETAGVLAVVLVFHQAEAELSTSPEARHADNPT